MCRIYTYITCVEYTPILYMCNMCRIYNYITCVILTCERYTSILHVWNICITGVYIYSTGVWITCPIYQKHHTYITYVSQCDIHVAHIRLKGDMATLSAPVASCVNVLKAVI